jgi:hypothetical protein
MRKAKRKPGHNPGMYRCANPTCDRTTPMNVTSYAMDPGPDVPAERLHYITEPDMPGFSICCASCAHYTIVSRFDQRPRA